MLAAGYLNSQAAVLWTQTESYMDDVKIGRAEADGFTQIRLLTQCGIPLDGLAEHQDTALAAYHKGRVVGSAILELHGQQRCCVQWP